MRLVSLIGSQGVRVGALVDSGVIDLHEVDPEIPACCIKTLLAAGAAGLDRAREAAKRGQPLPQDQVKILAPIPRPEKIFGIGLNYADHARETGKEPPQEPVVFSKFPTATLAPESPIVLPSNSSQVDYEGELVVVIGEGGRHIPKAEARRHIAGYCCGNDVSARDWQMGKPGGQWMLGKGFDTFAPFGPAIVTADEIPQPGRLRIQTRLNGKTMQDSNTNQLIFDVDTLVSYISDVCTLSPGDLIFTGTPPGVGVARKPPVFLQAGDTVEIEVEKLGTLRNPVVSESR